MIDLPILPDDEPNEPASSPCSMPEVEVYGAPRPAVPQRLPLTPRFAGCASGAGVGIGADAASPGFRRLPDWLRSSSRATASTPRPSRCCGG